MDGIILLYKEKGPTSFQTIEILKKKFKLKKIGHAGTLDPPAEGLLIALVNKGTKINDYIHTYPKEYEITVKFGAQTDTDDIEGAVIKECPPPDSPESAVNKILESFTGEIAQKAPAYSAISKDGKKLYKRARAGEKVDPPKRQVTIYKSEVISSSADTVSLKILCSTGTYMRSLSRDIGEKTGSCAHLYSLKRTKIGEFSADDASVPGDIENPEKHIIPLKDALYNFPSVIINAAQEKLVKNGTTFKHETCAETGTVKLIHNEKAVAIASVWGGVVKIKKGLW